MTYSFQHFLDAASTDWYADDALLQALLARYAPARGADAVQTLSAWGEQVAGRLRALAEESARPEHHPRLRPFDAYGRRVDEVVLPASTREALAQVEGVQRLGAVHGDPFVFYAMGYLYAQNGEAGVACSMACTDGLVRTLEALGDRPVHREAVEKVRGSTAGRVYHGAQFVTEIQGGSDVPANTVEAVPDGDAARLRGRKWFCSNINADYFLVTARPTGAPAGGRGVGLFLVPAYLEEGRGQRNGYTIDRLKDKLGTRELATAEVTFDGAVAYPVGAPDRGIANLVTLVLVPSRMACVSFAASALRRAERTVTAYTGFRTAFGRRLVDFPAVAGTVAEIASARARTLATFFELLRLWSGRDGAGVEPLDLRVMLSLSKAVLTRQATALLHEAMLLLGANGVEERFSPLPRLYRDAVIMETWEGPHNVLLDQALRDLARFHADPSSFVARVAGEPRADLARELGDVLRSTGDPAAVVRFGRVAERLVHAAGERVLAGLRQPGGAPSAAPG
jgi:alkylation response protein AidB-like acyl-CoA dehydrogenase